MSPDLAQRALGGGGQKPPEREPMVRQGPRPAGRTGGAGQSHDTAYPAFSPAGSVGAGAKLGHSAGYSTGRTQRWGWGVDNASLEDVCWPKVSPPSPAQVRGRGCGLWLRVVGDQRRNEESGHGAWGAPGQGRRCWEKARGASPATASLRGCPGPGGTGPSTPGPPRPGRRADATSNASLQMPVCPPFGQASGMTGVC